MNRYVEKLWKESFKGFYKQHSRSLWFYIFNMCGDESTADDIFQEAFYKYLKAAPTELNEFQQRAFLYKTAYRLLVDTKRRQKTARTYQPETVAETSREREISLSMDMEKMFQQLKPKEQNLLWLAHVEGYSHREIARITDTREKSLKVQLHRIRKKFAGILKQQGFPAAAGTPSPSAKGAVDPAPYVAVVSGWLVLLLGSGG